MLKYARRGFSGDGNHQFTFVGEIQGVQPQQFADAAHRIVDRQLRFMQFDTAAAGGGELVRHRVDAAAGGVA